jgi:elongation factor Ts
MATVGNPPITAAQVKELRAETNAPMMDCKRALVEAAGDFEAARALIRKRGLESHEKRLDRATPEGKVLEASTSSEGALVAIGAETESVAKSAEFNDFAAQVLAAVLKDGESALASLEAERLAVGGLLQENITVVGARRLIAPEAGRLVAYVHPPADKIGVLAALRGGDTPLDRQLAMQIAATAPRFAYRSDVPEDEIAREEAAYASSDEVLSKPLEARPKIVSGMLEKRFFGVQVLADQEWVHDTKLKVGDVLARAGVEVVDFARFALGR